MDFSTDNAPVEDELTLSYDDTTTYEDQVTTANSLASRISKSRIYLLADSVPRAAKRKHGDDEDHAAAIIEEGVDEDSEYRPNALLLQGPPISSLPTSRIFAYATHFDAPPLGLEWIDDTTCVLVFPSAASARAALARLQKPTSSPDAAGFVPLQPVPLLLWPPDARIGRTLGTGAGLTGAVLARPARKDDVKRRGARAASDFYRRHGDTAGKEVFNPDTGRVEPPPDARKRPRRDALDDDLDRFLAEGSPPPEDADPDAPRSKMYADQVPRDRDVRPLVERVTAPLPRRARGHPRGEENEGGRRAAQGEGRRGRGERTGARPKKSQQELDDELDAFLNERD